MDKLLFAFTFEPLSVFLFCESVSVDWEVSSKSKTIENKSIVFIS